METYYNKNKNKVEKLLNDSGLTAGTKTAIATDYRLALAGYYDGFQAKEKQIREALEKIKPNRAFMIDRYGFWRLLLQQYLNIYETIVLFRKIKDSDPDTKKRLIETFPDKFLRAAAWIMKNNDIVTMVDFGGVPPEIVTNFANTTHYVSDLTDYGNFYHLCKYAYCASPEELKTIIPPNDIKNLTDEKFTKFIDDFCKDSEKGLNEAEETYTAAMETPNPDLEKWNLNGVKLSANLTTVLQKPIEVQSKFITDTVPIRKYIADFPLIAGRRIASQSHGECVAAIQMQCPARIIFGQIVMPWFGRAHAGGEGGHEHGRRQSFHTNVFHGRAPSVLLLK